MREKRRKLGLFEIRKGYKIKVTFRINIKKEKNKYFGDFKRIENKVR
jgi:hypothetical protein